jgi:hypothetical protein
MSTVDVHLSRLIELIDVQMLRAHQILARGCSLRDGEVHL